MANSSTPGANTISTQYFQTEKREFHYLRNPRGYNEGMTCGNLGYQMHYSVESLEKQLADEGNPHVLQLNSYSYGNDWKNPDRWHLYVDGYRVAYGTGDYAHQCFEESAESFRDACRRAIEEAELPELSKHDYHLLCRARAIARFEPFDAGSNAHGKREGHVL